MNSGEESTFTFVGTDVIIYPQSDKTLLNCLVDVLAAVPVSIGIPLP